MEKQDKAVILVVDDIPDNIDVLRGVLKDKYKIKAASNGERALKIANSDNPPDLILLDIMMPDMDGFEVCRNLKSEFKTSKIPVIFVTAKDEVGDEEKGFDVGAVDYITKPISPPLVLRRVKLHLTLFNEKRLLSDLVKERTYELEKTRLQILDRLARAAEFRDNETGMHIKRMSHYSQLIALAYGMSEDESELLLQAAPMHDVGKIGIPDNILLKEGKLDANEWKVMMQHTIIGSEILSPVDDTPLLKMSNQIALEHHEKWNGQGYPNKLMFEEISIHGRIVAIADVFDALTSVRPYKKAWTVDDAVELIKSESGEHFDPELVEKFLEVLPEILKVKDRFAEFHLKGI